MKYIRSKALKGIKILFEGIESTEGTESTKRKKFIWKLFGKVVEEAEGLKAKGLTTEPIK